MIYVEIIPREVADVMRKSFNEISDSGGSVNNPIGYETLYDAIIVAEDVGSRLMRYVEPENLLFIFGKTIQSIGYAPIEDPLTPPALDEVYSVDSNGNSKKGTGGNQSKAKNRAIILCKLKSSNELEKFLSGKEKACGHNAKCYEITWRELQDLKKYLRDFHHHKAPAFVDADTKRNNLSGIGVIKFEYDSINFQRHSAPKILSWLYDVTVGFLSVRIDRVIQRVRLNRLINANEYSINVGTSEVPRKWLKIKDAPLPIAVSASEKNETDPITAATITPAITCDKTDELLLSDIGGKS